MRLLKSWPASIAVTCAMLAGCETAGTVDTVPATGVVTLDGKPVAGVSMTLVPQEGVKGRGGYAVTGEDGSYSFQVAPETEGVPAGYYRVLLQKYAMPDGSPIPPGASAADAGIVNVLPPVYSNPEESQVWVTFPSPDGQGTPIDLKSRLR